MLGFRHTLKIVWVVVFWVEICMMYIVMQWNRPVEALPDVAVKQSGITAF
jgi:hypothetical protein